MISREPASQHVAGGRRDGLPSERPEPVLVDIPLQCAAIASHGRLLWLVRRAATARNGALLSLVKCGGGVTNHA
jgi:hypothetical protein